MGTLSHPLGGHTMLAKKQQQTAAHYVSARVYSGVRKIDDEDRAATRARIDRAKEKMKKAARDKESACA